MNRRRAKSPLLLVILLLGAATVGCSQRSDSLDTRRANLQIAKVLTDAYSLSVDRVRCPTKIPIRKGDTFRCTAHIANTPLRLEVTQSDDVGGLSVKPAAAVLVSSRLEADMVEALAEKFPKAKKLTADCGSKQVRVLLPGKSFDCKVNDGSGQRRNVSVLVRDLDGSVSYTIR